MKIEFTTRGVISAFFRQRWKFVLVFALMILSGSAYLLFAKPEYDSTGSLLVKFGLDAMPEVTRPDNRPQVISQNDRRETIQSNMDILQSHNLLLATVREFGAEKLYPGITERVAGTDWPEEAAVRKLWKSDLTIKSSQQSNIIDVIVTNRNPEIAAQFMYKLFEHFISRQSEVFNKPQTDFLQEQVKEADAKLQRSQQKLKDFKAQKGISSIDDELDALLHQKGDTGTVSLGTMDDAWSQLSDLQSKEAQMLATYRPDSPQVQRAHQSVVLAERQLRQRQGDLSSRTGKATSQINSRIAELEEQRSKYNDLVRQVEIDEENYKNYELRAEDARVNETLNEKNITPIAIIDEPTVPMKPSRPRRLLVTAMTLLAGVILGGIAALIFETLDPRFTTPDQIFAELQVPVMAIFAATAEG